MNFYGTIQYENIIMSVMEFPIILKKLFRVTRGLYSFNDVFTKPTPLFLNHTYCGDTHSKYCQAMVIERQLFSKIWISNESYLFDTQYFFTKKARSSHKIWPKDANIIHSNSIKIACLKFKCNKICRVLLILYQYWTQISDYVCLIVWWSQMS